MEQEFLQNGYIIADVEDEHAFEWISKRMYCIAAKHLSIQTDCSVEDFFDGIHAHVTPQSVNDLRLAIIQDLTMHPEFKKHYYHLGMTAINRLVGNELAIQKGIGLNIQLPQDSSSLLPIHSDIWGSECSPFEVVMWLPLVDCFRTKSLFILPPERDRFWRNQLHEFQSMEDVFQAVQDDLVWIDIKRGQFLIFTHTILHGNRTNLEATTRWSINIRFKSLFSPYAGKGFGDYFQPLEIKPATKIGMEFQFPRIRQDFLKKGHDT